MLSGLLTILLLALLIAQFHFKKGTVRHAVRGIVVVFVAIAAILANTIPAINRDGFIWDWPFIFHVSTGLLFGLCLWGAILTGANLHDSIKVNHRNIAVFRSSHRILVYASCFFLLLSIAGIFLVKFFR